MNIYDSFKIQQRMIYKKYIQVFNPIKANILILNTCSIRQKAQNKIFDQLGRWRKLLKNNNIIIVVGGCGVIKDANLILKRMPFVNIIFSPQTLYKIPYLIKLYKIKKNPIIYLNNKSTKFLSKFVIIPKYINYKSLSAYITIMEGCNKFCSYCIVPYTRGKEKSRPVKDILNEINILISKGIKEIFLLGQNVNAYKGIIINNNKKIICCFSELLEFIIKIPEIKRIRFLSSNPIEFTNDIISKYKSNKLANLLHLPIQSGSNVILKKMNRNYTVEKYYSIIENLKKIRSDINISSDFIVGYPEEKAKDILKTLNIINLIKFDKSYSFIYSPRPGTVASKIINNLSINEKKRRLYLIQYSLNRLIKEINYKMINTYQKVLITNFFNKDNNILLGITDNNRKILFKGKKKLIGNINKVKILTFKRNFFLGKLI